MDEIGEVMEMTVAAIIFCVAVTVIMVLAGKLTGLW